MTVDEFIERYLPDVEVYEWQRAVIQKVLDPDYRFVITRGRRAGYWTLAKPVAEYRADHD